MLNHENNVDSSKSRTETKQSLFHSTVQVGFRSGFGRDLMQTFIRTRCNQPTMNSLSLLPIFLLPLKLILTRFLLSYGMYVMRKRKHKPTNLKLQRNRCVDLWSNNGPYTWNRYRLFPICLFADKNKMALKYCLFIHYHIVVGLQVSRPLFIEETKEFDWLNNHYM